MRKILLDFIFSILGSYVFYLFKNSTLYFGSYTGHPKYSFIEQLTYLSLLDGIIQGLICFALILISLRVLHSYWVLLVSSSIVTFLGVWKTLGSAESGNLSLKKNGHDIFINGDITGFGYLHVLLKPTSVLVIFAGYILIYSALKKYSEYRKSN